MSNQQQHTEAPASPFKGFPLKVVMLNGYFDWIFVGYCEVNANGMMTIHEARNVFSYDAQKGSASLAKDRSAATRLTDQGTFEVHWVNVLWASPCDRVQWAKEYPETELVDQAAK
jgi:hypothetical protein